MLTKDFGSIRNDERHLGAYERVPAIVEYIDSRAAYDETGGDAEAPTGWFGLSGRWVIGCNERGSFSALRFDSVDAAHEAYDNLEAEYSAWGDDGFPDEGLDDESYGAYVERCEDEGLEAFGPEMWEVQGRPQGPLG